ncbi:MAG: pirin family protein [Ilumatobacter sp.]|nr:pirin family protein [Ilumatobacter sp.]
MGTILQTFPLGPQWPTIDPFLFVAHHRDAYPRGTAELGPDAPLTGRTIGQDFAGIDGWNMYHGATVPGFPQHPHRGFETITYVRTGCCDHSDSLGATARFGRGDTQWMTAGAGVVHSEVFPLLDAQRPNPLELFQIWLNLPAADKLVDPYFTMLWSERTPTIAAGDANGALVDITVIAGAPATTAGEDAVTPPAPPPNSWAARAEADVAIWHLRFDAGATWTMPAASGPETNRVLYAFSGSSIDVDGESVAAGNGAVIDPRHAVELTAGDAEVECIVLQGRPIGEPVAQYGPFVMNTEAEIRAAFDDYRRSQFGGWPWPSDAPHHGPTRGRFALHADGRLETIDDAQPLSVPER